MIGFSFEVPRRYRAATVEAEAIKDSVLSLAPLGRGRHQRLERIGGAKSAMPVATRNDFGRARQREPRRAEGEGSVDPPRATIDPSEKSLLVLR